MIEIKKFDVADYLKTEEDIVKYLKVVSEEKNPDLLIKAIGDVARAKSINKISKDIGVNRESLYKSLSGDVGVNFKTIYNVLDVLGLELTIIPKRI